MLTIAREQNLNGLRELGRMRILHLILHITSKAQTYVGYMKSMGDRLGREEKAKCGSFFDWINGKMIGT